MFLYFTGASFAGKRKHSRLPKRLASSKIIKRKIKKKKKEDYISVNIHPLRKTIRGNKCLIPAAGLQVSVGPLPRQIHRRGIGEIYSTASCKSKRLEQIKVS